MTREEAIYCMESYLPESSEHCGKCRYYGINTGKEGERYCMSSEAHRMAIQALEQEHALDKIRAETMKFQTYKMFEGEDTVYVDRDDVLAIIDKYKAESEEEEWKN